MGENGWRGPAWFEVVCWSAVGALTAWFVVSFAVTASSALGYPFQRDYGEGVVLDQVARLADGRAIYTDWNVTQTACTYPPCYHLLATWWMDPRAPRFFPGRMISVCATFGCALAAGLIAWELTRRRLASLLAAFVVFAIPPIHAWGTFYRVDMLGLFFSLAGTWWVIRFGRAAASTSSPPEAGGDALPAEAASAAVGSPQGEEGPGEGEDVEEGAHPVRPRGRGRLRSQLLYLGVWWFIAALFTKHSLAAAPVAAVVGLFALDRRRGATFALLLVLLGVLIFATLDFGTHHLFWANVITANSPGLKPFGGGDKWLDTFFRMFIVTSVLAVVYIPLGWRRWAAAGGDQRAGWNVLGLYVITALLMTLPEKRGAWTNYQLEFLVVSHLAAVVCVVEIVARAKRLKPLASTLLALLLAGQFGWMAATREIYPSPVGQAKREREQRVLDAVRSVRGSVISQNVGMVVLAGKHMVYQPLVMTQLARAGRWDPSDFIRELDRREFGAVLLDGPIDQQDPGFLFTNLMLDAIARSYTLKQSFRSRPVGAPREFLYEKR